MQCFINKWNTEKRVENTTHSGVFLTNFEVFHLAMKLCVKMLDCTSQKKTILEGEIKDAKMISKH